MLAQTKHPGLLLNRMIQILCRILRVPSTQSREAGIPASEFGKPLRSPKRSSDLEFVVLCRHKQAGGANTHMLRRRPFCSRTQVHKTLTAILMIVAVMTHNSASIQRRSLEVSSKNVFSFTGQDLAPLFFQASLLPYLLFLYFLSCRGNRIPSLANFGFQFVLAFVVATIVTGVLAKNVFGLSLANVDWLHGSAESLLTIANILIVS